MHLERKKTERKKEGQDFLLFLYCLIFYDVTFSFNRCFLQKNYFNNFKIILYEKCINVYEIFVLENYVYITENSLHITNMLEVEFRSFTLGVLFTYLGVTTWVTNTVILWGRGRITSSPSFRFHPDWIYSSFRIHSEANL